MNKEMKSKLIEAASFCACLAIILGIGFYSGYLKGFSAKDFGDAYQRITMNLSNSSFVKNNNITMNEKTSSQNHSISYGYRIQRIPESVLRGVNSTGAWNNIFKSSKKTVFYTYNNSSDKFDASVKNYLSRPDLAGQYSVYSYTENQMNSMRVGDIGTSKICDSLEECNAVRQKASDYTALAEFMKYCGRGMCIINPSKAQYVYLKNKNYNDAANMLKTLQNWQ